MKIGIIGSGNMGSGLARRITFAGHDVLMTARDLNDAEKTAQQIGPRVKVVPPTEVAKGVDVLIAATPAGEQVNALKSCGDLKGKGFRSHSPCTISRRHSLCKPSQGCIIQLGAFLS